MCIAPWLKRVSADGYRVRMLKRTRVIRTREVESQITLTKCGRVVSTIRLRWIFEHNTHWRIVCLPVCSSAPEVQVLLTHPTVVHWRYDRVDQVCHQRVECLRICRWSHGLCWDQIPSLTRLGPGRKHRCPPDYPPMSNNTHTANK